MPDEAVQTNTVPLPRTAYYTDGLAWGDLNWPKSMLLFFEQVAVLVPEAEQDAFERSDEAVIAGLRENDLLRVLRPEELVDKNASERIVSSVRSAFGKLPKRRAPGAPMLIYLNKLDGGTEIETVAALVKDLEKAGVAQLFAENQSMIIRPELGYLILDAIAQESIRTGTKLGLDLFPSRCTGGQRDLISGYANLDLCPGATVVHTDMEEVGVNLGPVPIDEILGFKRDNVNLLNRYRLGLDEFSRSLAATDVNNRAALILERKEMIETTKSEFKSAFKDWKTLARLGVGLAGVCWTGFSGDPTGAKIAAASVGLELLPKSEPSPNRLTYLIRASRKF